MTRSLNPRREDSLIAELKALVAEIDLNVIEENLWGRAGNWRQRRPGKGRDESRWRSRQREESMLS